MLRPKKKISKRELKQDTLVTTYVKATTFYGNNKKNISIGITALVVIVFAVVVYFKNRADNNEKAVTQLGSIFQTYDAGQFQVAIDGIPERNIPGLKAIVDNYGNSQTGELARLYLANAYLLTGKADDALRNFEECTPADDLLAAARLSGIAASHEARGDHKQAAEYFEKAATKFPKDINAAENLSNAARNFGQAGEKTTAIELYRRIKKGYPGTSFARDADRFISQLSV